MAIAVAIFCVISINYYLSANHESMTTKYITLGNRRISILNSGSGSVYKIEQSRDNDPCLLPGCTGRQVEGTWIENLRKEFSTQHLIQPTDGLAQRNSSPCTGVGQGCSSLHPEGLNVPNSSYNPVLSGQNTHLSRPGKADSSFIDRSSSAASEICYHYTEAGRCALAPCPGQQTAHTHYRGFVREVQYPAPAHPNRTYGACFMCSLYSRQCMVSVAHRSAANSECEHLGHREKRFA
jgi:hypothetical protein